MKVEIVETLNFPPEIIFAIPTDIPHQVDWLDEPVELISIRDGPAKLGTRWEQNVGSPGEETRYIEYLQRLRNEQEDRVEI